MLRGASVEASRDALRRVFLGALFMNWRVWTLTQWLSFHYVPPQLRVLWGSVHTLPFRISVRLTSRWLAILTLYLAVS